MKKTWWLIILCFFLLSSQLINDQTPEIRFLSPKGDGTWIGVQKIAFQITGYDQKSIRTVEVYIDGKFVREFESPPYEFNYDFGQVPQKRVLRVVVQGVNRLLMRRDIASYPYDATEEVNVIQVVVPVVVTKETGSTVRNLKKEDFLLYEDGVLQELNEFRQGGKMDFKLTLLIDISSSMLDKIDRVKQAATMFLEQVMTKNDEANLIFFNHETFEDTGFTDNVNDILNSIEMVFPYGKTALYDAVAYGLRLFRGQQGRNIIVVFTDGEDNSSFIDPYTLTKQSEKSNVVIYAIGPKLYPLGDRKYWDLLKEITNSSGGLTFFFTSVNDIEGFYAQIKQDIQAQYILQYSPKGIEKLNRFRKIEVKIKDHDDYQIRTIRGYYY